MNVTDPEGIDRLSNQTVRRRQLFEVLPMAHELKRFIDRPPDPGSRFVLLDHTAADHWDTRTIYAVMISGLGHIQIQSDVVLNPDQIRLLLSLETKGWSIYGTRAHFEQLGPHIFWGRLWN